MLILWGGRYPVCYEICFHLVREPVLALLRGGMIIFMLEEDKLEAMIYSATEAQCL